MFGRIFSEARATGDDQFANKNKKQPERTANKTRQETDGTNSKQKT